MADQPKLRRTPLAEAHEALGGRMVEFGGWWMPVQYTSILEEHEAVRTAAGLFDISHMGEFFVAGGSAGLALNRCLSNDIDKLAPGKGQYTFLLNARGGVVDDLIVYQVQAESYLLVVNASMIAQDFQRLGERLGTVAGAVTLDDRSEATGALALQGPSSSDVLAMLLSVHKVALPDRNCIQEFDWQGLTLLIARTGYTGEDGFEIFASADALPRLWEALLDKGSVMGVKPCGLGARDTLRLEACYPLNGQDLTPDRTPIEAGLGAFVSVKKIPEYPGKDVCARQKRDGVKEKLVAFRMLERGAPPRPHYRILAEGVPIGEVTSGAPSPTLKCGIGMGYVDAAYAEIGRRIDIEVRGNPAQAVLVEKPFYKRAD